MISIRRLEVHVVPGTVPEAADQPYPTVEFTLDGRTLQDWVRRSTPARREPQHYLGHHVSVDLAALLSGGLAYPPDDEPGEFRWEQWGGFTPILGCTCTVIECGPLLCRIAVSDDRVTWTDLQDGFREELDYGLAFSFERGAYDAAVAAGLAEQRAAQGQP